MDLHVSTAAERWDLEVGRDGQAYEVVLTASELAGQHHETPEASLAIGCGWPVAYRFEMGADWRPGGYVIAFRAERAREVVEEHHIILVRAAEGAPRPPYVLFCATPTWQAYNCWGGSNRHEAIAGPEGNAFSPALSLERPWSRVFCRLPEGAPWAVPDRVPRHGEMARYPYMEWAYAYRYSQKYASARWASYERHFARWAEGHDVDVLSLHDLDRSLGLFWSLMPA